MKKIFFAFLFALFAVSFAQAQEDPDISGYFTEPILLDAIRGAGRYVPNEGPVTAEELATVYLLDLSRLDIADLSGIEHLTGLVSLYLVDNPIFELDLGLIPSLRRLRVYNTYMRERDDVIGHAQLDEFQFGIQNPDPPPRPTDTPEIPAEDIATGEDGATTTEPTAEPEPPYEPTAEPDPENDYGAEDENGEAITGGDNRNGGNRGAQDDWRATETNSPSTVATVFTWVMVAMIFVTFLISIILLIIRIRNS
jgi:hypothetical protein